MFFFYATVHPLAPRQILESGRMRGGSTLILARCFPQARIVSVEFDRDSTHAAIAEEKLKPYANVELLYGDSREILPRRLQPGDAVLIDGPKDFRALKFALRLLRTGKPCAVLILTIFTRVNRREGLSSNIGPAPFLATTRRLRSISANSTCGLAATRIPNTPLLLSYVCRPVCPHLIRSCYFG
jgi:hypothetical protein